jgi:hypothetical protein
MRTLRETLLCGLLGAVVVRLAWWAHDAALVRMGLL